MTMHLLRLNSSGLLPRLLEGMVCGSLRNLIRLLVFGVQCELWLVTFILDGLISGNESSSAKDSHC